MNIDITKDELSLVLSAIGVLLLNMSLNVRAGQPLSSEMIELEALQTKLMKVSDGQ